MEREGKQVIATKEPTSDSEAGRKIIAVLTHKETVSSKELQELFVIDRAAHVKNVIEPALTEGKWVISDRYFLSTIAFGGIDCDQKWLKEINDPFVLPDITFLMKVRAEVSLERIATRGKDVELFEKKEKLETVMVNYAKLAEEYEHCRVVDGEQPIGAVHAAIVSLINPLLS